MGLSLNVGAVDHIIESLEESLPNLPTRTESVRHQQVPTILCPVFIKEETWSKISDVMTRFREQTVYLKVLDIQALVSLRQAIEGADGRLIPENCVLHIQMTSEPMDLDDGWEAIATELCKLPFQSLKRLSLSRSGISADGMRRMMGYVATTRNQLKILDLSHILMTSDHLIALQTALMGNQTLRILYMDSDISQAGMMSFLTSVRFNRAGLQIYSSSSCASPEPDSSPENNFFLTGRRNRQRLFTSDSRWPPAAPMSTEGSGPPLSSQFFTRER